MPALVGDASDLGVLLTRFPTVSWAAAYGSGVFPSSNAPSQMVDLILAVDRPEEWHRDNLNRNPSDYSFVMRQMGHKAIAQVQEYAAGAYYNPYIPVSANPAHGLPNPLMIKYGVISVRRLIDDLRNWSSLYMAGRMHKPIHLIKSQEDIDLAQAENLESAMMVSLLLSPRAVSERNLFMRIAELSFAGRRISFMCDDFS
eukprot:TRINITY_DN9720_c0_g1_i2.p1 TRINITY_DN9720_c0_g1~~TRINITY_DN9720_c0_g1_i2.p1  ORF type:complete len:200 (+),score=28.33 TRINITY_DN9720_c0_g1_i2:18-617(+)